MGGVLIKTSETFKLFQQRISFPNTGMEENNQSRKHERLSFIFHEGYTKALHLIVQKSNHQIIFWSF